MFYMQKYVSLTALKFLSAKSYYFLFYFWFNAFFDLHFGSMLKLLLVVFYEQ